MAEKTIKTKILLRYDVLSAWTTANPELKTGEVAIVAIPTDSNELNINGTTPPQILFKVGPGNFNDLPYASGKAADVYSWAKEASLSITKEGEGNVVSGIAWDAAANNGKGGIKFTTTSVATSTDLEDVKDRLDAIEGDGEKSRITLLEEGLAATNKVIEDNSAAWAKDDNTTYTFATTDKGFTVTSSEGEAKTITFDYLTADEVASAITAYGYKDEAGVKAIVEGYGYKNEADVKSIVEGYGYQTSAQVESAITSKGYQTSSDVENAITSKGYQTADNVNSLIANSALATTVAELSEDVTANANDIKDLGDELDGYFGEDGRVTVAEGKIATLEGHFGETGRVTVAEGKISELEGKVGNLSGAFQFKGTAEKLEDLPAASADNAGHVYVVGNKEYASDGSSWILLGDEGSYVLKTTYEAHLTAQAAVDQGQSDKIAAIEKDIADNRAAWASKTSVTDPTSGDGKITVDGTEITVYDDSALAGRVTTVEGKVKTLEETTVPALDNRIKEVEKIKITSTSVTDGTNTFEKYDDTALAARVKELEDNPYVLPEDVVQDANYKHITVTETSVSDGTTTFTKYDDTALANRVTAVENEFKTVDDTKGKVVELEDRVAELEAKPDITITETSVSDGTNTFTKYDDTELAGRVKAVEDNFADWAIIWDCGGASNN